MVSIPRTLCQEGDGLLEQEPEEFPKRCQKYSHDHGRPDVIIHNFISFTSEDC